MQDELIYVRFNKNCPGFAHFPGMVDWVRKVKAQPWLDMGYMTAITPEVPKIPELRMPEADREVKYQRRRK